MKTPVTNRRTMIKEFSPHPGVPSVPRVAQRISMESMIFGNLARTRLNSC